MTIRKEEAVSDVIGVLLLISIATIALGIVGVQFISQVSVTNLPEADLSIIWQEDPADNVIKPYIIFERGEPLDINSTKILVDETDITKNPLLEIKKTYTDMYKTWNDDIVSFSIGDSLKWNSTEKAEVISIIFYEAGKEILLQSSNNPFKDN
ncbi:MAG: type IV pilin [Methanomicrobiales archaeon]|nr:type IV pilin [Methanomicrobiales archaeon]